MVRTKDGDIIKSNLIISEVQKRACLYDTNHPHYADRTVKIRAWEEVCSNVVPGWSLLGPEQKFAAAKEVQKRWRSIRDSFTKAYRQGKCVRPEQCAPGSRRAHYNRQMAFLYQALQNKKPRNSQDKYESLSEVSNSPQYLHPDDFVPKIKSEFSDKPLDLKKSDSDETRDETPQNIDEKRELKSESKTMPLLPEKEKSARDNSLPAPVTDKKDQTQQTVENNSHPVEMKNQPLEIKIDANSILPDDHLDDDKLFMNSLIPLFKKMDDDTRLLCRIEVLKIIRYALQGHKSFEALRIAEDSFFTSRISGFLDKEDKSTTNISKQSIDSTLSIVTRSADGSRPIRKRKIRSPSPLPTPTKKRGPGRPRKVRPPSSDEDYEDLSKKNIINGKKTKQLLDCEPRLSELDEKLSKATSVAQLETTLFMKMMNLERSKNAPQLAVNPMATQALQVSVKTEPLDELHPS